ncbi:MAG TPA: molecular chaperone TorD family protein [Verrucomicrobiae bacterium]
MGVTFAEPAEARIDVGRARLFGFLAGVFSSPPTEESGRVVLEMATLLDIDCPRALPVNELEREFMELFVVPNPRYVAPYESAYRDQWPLPPGLAVAPGPGEAPRTAKRLLMGQSTMQVRQCFLEAGVEPMEDLPDHISNELRLMSYLWSGEAQGAYGGDGRSPELRAKLREDHLLKWVSELRSKVSEHERLGFYSAVLRIVELVLQDDPN